MDAILDLLPIWALCVGGGLAAVGLAALIFLAWLGVVLTRAEAEEMAEYDYEVGARAGRND